MSEFEKQVRIALIQQGKTLSKFADELGISVSYLYEIMKGTRKADEKKQTIVTLLGLDIESNEQIINQ